ncbi:MAG: phosphoglycerate dehydrogenase [Anaerolineae bacterium]|nr:phosphoglycerate dehydrogenase [Anaerolineae bacterium]
MSAALTPLAQCRVLVTPTSYGRHDARLLSDLRDQVGEVILNPHPRPLTSAEVRDLLPGVDGMIAGLDALDAAALAGADRLRVIARYGVGVERVDLAAARARGIIVCNTPGANAAAVAELTLGCLIALARGLVRSHNALRGGDWLRLSGQSLTGKTLGLVGFGAIARQVAPLAQAFGCRVIASDPFVPPEAMQALGVTAVPLAALLPQSDFVSLHSPVTAATRHLVNADFLAQMKPGALLVNTARGELIDEGALLAALDSGQVAGAALDAFTQEPPPAGDPLLAHPAVIVTPHIGGNSDSAATAMGWLALHDCLAVLRGAAPRHPVT